MLKCSHIYYCEVFTILLISSLFTDALENQFKANFFFLFIHYPQLPWKVHSWLSVVRVPATCVVVLLLREASAVGTHHK